MDPLADRAKLAGRKGAGRRHNALEDVLIAVEIYRAVMRGVSDS